MAENISANSTVVIHQINTQEKLDRALNLAAKKDVLLLIEAATSLLLNNQLAQQLVADYQVKVLATDLAAAGINCPVGVEAITDAQWVNLTLGEEKYICW